MALNTEKKLKLYYSIKEVAEMLGVSESMLRFWEKEIPMIKPKTTGNNIRQYTEQDIENIKVVYNLVKVRGFKLAAARKMLKEQKRFRKPFWTETWMYQWICGIHRRLQRKRLQRQQSRVLRKEKRKIQKWQ